MRGAAWTLAAGCAAASLAGCALLAGYDFGKYGEDLGDGGPGGHGGAGASVASSAHASSHSAASSATSTGSGEPGCVDGGTGTFGGPSIFVPGTTSAFSITNDAKNVYFTSDGPDAASGTVSRTDKGGAITSVIAQKQSSPRGIQVDDVNLYWFGHQLATSSEIWRLDKTSSGTAMPFPIWSVSPGIVNAIALSGSILYFSYDGMGVYQIDLVASSYQRVVQNTAGKTPAALAADATGVYYVEQPVMPTPGQTSIMRFNPTTQTGGPVAVGEDGVQGLVAAGANLYWSTPAGVRWAPKLGGVPPMTIGGFPGPCAGMAADETYLYCALSQIPEIFVIQLAAESPYTATTVPGQSLRGVTAGCEAVYFTADTNVGKLPK